MNHKYLIAIAAAVAISSFNLGDRKPAGAQDLEIQTAVRIPGPPIVIQKSLVLSLDERLSAQQLIWEYRMKKQLDDYLSTNLNTDAPTAQINPLPAFSGFLTDAYSFLKQK